MATILVLDDEADTRETVKEVLTGAGHQVITADNGTEGLACCRKYEPDLLITDLIMPGEDGFEVLQKLGAGYPRLPIIAITGQDPAGEYGYLELAEAFGASRCLEKPFDVSELRSIVEDLLSKGSDKEPGD